MVARGPGAVGCAHCRAIGAAVTCRVCGRQVCQRCEADWTTCDDRVAITTRLGRRARLRDVDPAGRYAVVSRWNDDPQLLDLRRMAWVGAMPGFASSGESWVLGDGFHVGSRWVFLEHEVGVGFDRFVVTRFGQAPRRIKVDLDYLDHPKSGYRLDGRLVWCVTAQENIGVLDLDTQRWSTFEPLPGKVVQAASLDPRDRTLAVATWGTLMLVRLGEDGPTVLLRGPVPGDVSWIGVRGDTLVACADGGRTVIVWDLDPSRTVARERLRCAYGLGDRVRRADLSRDGRYLAVALDRRLVVHDLERRDQRDLAEHSDSIGFVRFAGAHLLVVGDDDSRVVVRPRTQAGYDQRVVEVPLAPERVPYELPPA